MSSAPPSRPTPSPATSNSRQSKGGCISVTLAFILLSVVITFMLALPMGNIGLAILMFVGFIALIATMHYFIWGRVLTRMIEREQRAAAQEVSDPD
tara:strand:- start:150 stop:437 length:288 start_codon:yes stop_codon:yes gene_type:complete